MVFVEAVQALFSLDLGFFIDIVMNNLLWVFLLYALVHYFFDGKHILHYFLLLSLMMWAWADLEKITGLAWTAASFLLIYYITKLAVIAWAENSPGLKNKIVVISELQFLLLLFIFTFFIK
ncbi:MAG: hypothetical protein AABW99_01355 [archaeon]